MRAVLIAMLVAACAALPSATLHGEEGPWLDDLEQGKRLAAQTNRLVLVHFWATWCGPCVKLDKGVFADPAVFRDLSRTYVFVKLNVDEHKEIAKRYGAPPIPVDVVITPTGEVVGKTISPQAASVYVAKLQGIATAAGVSAASAGELASRETAERQAAHWPAPQGGAATTAGVTSNDDRYRGGDWPAGGVAEPIGPRYGSQQTGPQLNGPLVEPPQPNQPDLPEASRSGDAGWGANAAATASDAATPDQSTSASDPALDWSPGRGESSAGGDWPNVDRRTFDAPTPRAPTETAVTPGSSPPQVQLPPGAAPLAMRGFSPVATLDAGRWMPGDVRYGATHAGRTYLFASQEEQQRFLRDHRRYAPVLDGMDVVLLAETGRRVEGDLAAGAVLYPKSSANRRLYLFAGRESMEKFERDPERYLQRLAQMQQGGVPRPALPSIENSSAQSPPQQPRAGAPRGSTGIFGLRRSN